MKQCIVYTLKGVNLVLLPQHENSTIVPNLWNLTPVKEKGCVFQSVQLIIMI